MRDNLKINGIYSMLKSSVLSSFDKFKEFLFIELVVPLWDKYLKKNEEEIQTFLQLI